MTEALAAPHPYSISRRLLLGIYSIVPLAVLIVLIDMIFLGQQLQPIFRFELRYLPFYLLIFDLPHQLASLVSYADTEYLKHYRRQLLIRLPLILLITIAIININLLLAFLVFLVFSAHHAIKQQTGIAGMLAQKRGWLHLAWSYGAITSFFAITLYIFARFHSGIPEGFAVYESIFVVVGGFLLISVFFIRTITNSLGRWYVIANTAMVLVSVILVMLNYFFLALFMARFVHDVTAFVFYSVHDGNRNAVEIKNSIYKFLRRLRLPFIIVTPILGVVLAYVFRVELGFGASITAIYVLGVTHYYIESFMWKGDSLHRQQLRFS